MLRASLTERTEGSTDFLGSGILTGEAVIGTGFKAAKVIVEELERTRGEGEGAESERERPTNPELGVTKGEKGIVLGVLGTESVTWFETGVEEVSTAKGAS